MSFFEDLPNIDALATGGGEFTHGAAGPVECAATASDQAQCMEMLVKRDDESIGDLLRRVDAAIEQAQDHGVLIDEIKTLSRGT